MRVRWILLALAVTALFVGPPRLVAAQVMVGGGYVVPGYPPYYYPPVAVAPYYPFPVPFPAPYAAPYPMPYYAPYAVAPGFMVAPWWDPDHVAIRYNRYFQRYQPEPRIQGYTLHR